MLSIPVFFDVTFIILIPIGITIAAKIDMKMCYVTGCLTIGATTAHCVVPPTPNPLAAADIFGFDLGIMMIVGLVVGFITVIWCPTSSMSRSTTAASGTRKRT